MITSDEPSESDKPPYGIICARVVELYIDGTYSHLSSGTTINIKIHSAGGMDYIKLVELV